MAQEHTHHGVLAHAREAISDALDIFGAAVRAADAVDNHRDPEPGDLDRLGIDRDALPHTV